LAAGVPIYTGGGDNWAARSSDLKQEQNENTKYKFKGAQIKKITARF
jgi:hypothetical protein